MTPLPELAAAPLYPILEVLHEPARKLAELKAPLPSKPWYLRKLGKTYQGKRKPKCRVTDDLSKRL